MERASTARLASEAHGVWHGHSSMLNPLLPDYCRIAPTENPRLVVVIDTEEEFDWSRGFSRSNTAVRSMRWIERVQAIFDEYSIVPVYVVDYPVITQPDGYRSLQEIHATGRCLIGAHLHPWVTPPFDEPVNRANSFPGNLPPALEAVKLKILGDAIEERFGIRPTIYKAGRYGVGPNTAAILEDQGYEIDMSVCPHMDYSGDGGPDFTSNSAWPYWFGTRRHLLELPLTVGYVGLCRRWGPTLHGLASLPEFASLHTIGLLAQLNLVNRIWLSPEGYSVSEHMKLVRALYNDGLRIFSFAFHSPSLEPGNTPYVSSRAELERFLSRCRRFFDGFLGDFSGRPTTPLELKNKLARSINEFPVEAA